MKLPQRLLGSPFRALTVLSLLAFLIANTDMLIEGLRVDDPERSENGGFGVAVFALLLMLMGRRFLGTDPDPRTELARARRFAASPIRIVIMASLGFFVVGSYWVFVNGLVAGEVSGIIDGSVGVSLMGYLGWIVIRGFESVDRHDAHTPAASGVPVWQRAAAAMSVVERTVGRSYFRARFMRLMLLFFFSSFAAAWVALTDGEWLTVIFWLAVIVLFGVLITLAVGAFTLRDEQRRGDGA